MKTELICALAAVALLTGCSSIGGSSESKIKIPAASATTEADTTAEAVPEATEPPRSAGTKATTTAAELPTQEQTSAETSTEDEGLLTRPMFSSALSGVDVSLNEDSVIQTGNVRGTDYTLTIDLSNWEQNTTPTQLVELSRLFWQCYPRMYERYGDLSGAPTSVTLAVENTGYEIAESSGNFVHLHDMWLCSNTDDFDCITHELAHVVQYGWNGDNLEYSSYIERFADCCRYEYALDNGAYNDVSWVLQTVDTESDRETSVRFLVWLDYNYTNAGTDIMRNYFRVCRNGGYSEDVWNIAWSDIFAGTDLEGKTIDEVWDIYVNSDFAYLPSNAPFGCASELRQKYDIRSKLS
ncbi:MAG: hypothetical protein IKO47_13195 [Ruminococcus sp.]|nr:hypothetical protein [Ruminococcus sp.]